ncbi:phosphoglucosamine mutase [Alkalimarinus alittae]|uniref:Phosphoglucosamine mutase n=1 Tax=Alkalimarinus alittae TaxID=2961619 RepID=A0ABY6N4A8_9ALTE|nr:phosphoglucosamine mutase [Alkalimarinus alittae]UZE96849.1 phosphoglucosamine mutase [Alkalimarinus alittae]
MGARKYFGTDGIRGKVGEGAITPEFVLKLGWAVGQAFKQQGQRGKVLIGKDTRLSGYMFESALEAGLSAAGVDVGLLGPMPTPAIAYLTRTFRASAGIVISASHNPHYDNGIKFFSQQGFKLDDTLERKIEDLLEQDIEVVESAHLGKASRIEDAAGRYVEFCKSTVPYNMSLEGLNIVLDCAHGATYHVAPSVFKELGANITTLGVEPNGLNINKDVGSTSPEQLVKAVLEQGADLGIAFDGDGDRVVMVDHKGEVVDGDELIYVIASNRHRGERLGGGVVGTLMTNFGAELAYQKMGVPFIRANVGDRYVMEKLVANDWLLGGEGSGHILCLDNSTTGDAIISALQVLIAMWEEGKTLNEMKGGMEKLPQTMVNVKVAKKFNPAAHPDIAKAITEAEERFAGEGRILLRASGTEPVIRVMAEGRDEALVLDIVSTLAKVVESAKI